MSTSPHLAAGILPRPDFHGVSRACKPSRTLLDVRNEAAQARRRRPVYTSDQRCVYRAAIRRKMAAFHVHVQLGCIAQGLLQHLSLNYTAEVWLCFRSWLRTMNPALRHRSWWSRTLCVPPSRDFSHLPNWTPTEENPRPIQALRYSFAFRGDRCLMDRSN